MALTVAVEVEHLPLAAASASSAAAAAATSHPRILLVPNLNPHASVKSSLKKFIREHLYIPEDLQCLTAPLFSPLSEQASVEDIYSNYSCHADAESSDLHVDEESFSFFGRERGKFVELHDLDRLDERHVIDECKLHLKRLPQSLPEGGGRIFVETKNGILPLLDVKPRTPVSEIKKTLELLTGVPASQQLLSSVGRVMHDEFFVGDFDGLHTIYEDSTIDLCKSEDSNAEQAHRRMSIQVNIAGEHEISLIVQGRDSVRSVMQAVESRSGYAEWQQRLLFSGKAMDERKNLADYFIYPHCILQVNIFKYNSKFGRKTAAGHLEQSEELLDEEKKPPARKLKLVRTCKGIVMGTLTIPVLTSDKVYDLKRKIKRSLQPLVERNLSSMHTPVREPKHIDITPRSSPATASVMSSIRSANSMVQQSPPSSADSIKLASRKFSSSSSFRGSTYLNSPSRVAAARSSLSTGSSPLQQQAQQAGCPSMTARQASTLSPLPKTTQTAIGTQAVVAADANANNTPRPWSTFSKSLSARRLEFGTGTQAAALNVCDEGDDGGATASSPRVDRRGLGAWINGSVQAIKDQIRSVHS